MKKQFLVLIISLFAQFITAQTLQLSDLLTLSKCQVFSCFNNYVITHGFSYSEKDDLNGYIFFGDENIWTNTKNGINFPIRNSLTYNSLGERLNSFILTYLTYSKKEYISFLNDLQEKGFFEYKTYIEDSKSKDLVTNYKSERVSKIIIEVDVRVVSEVIKERKDSANGYLIIIKESNE